MNEISVFYHVAVSSAAVLLQHVAAMMTAKIMAG